MKPEYFDIHSHLDFKDFDNDRNEVIEELKKNNIWATVVGVDLATSKKAVELAGEHDNLFATVGIHPADNANEIFNEDTFSELLRHPKVVAIGECGLDYFNHGAGIISNEEKDRQKREFEKQIECAVKYNKPLMIHCRDAYPDALAILRAKKKEYSEKLRGNFHFFTSPVETAKECLELGFTLSFTGPITYTSRYDDLIRFVPLSMLMVESDSPFAAPVPYRGRRNSPLFIKEIVQKIADVKGENIEKVKQQVVDTALRVFGAKAV